MKNISQYSISHRSVISFLMCVMLLGGIYAFLNLGKREDSTFTIKTAVVVCPYGGATPEEVESVITEPLERAIRTLSSVHKICSESHFGYSRLLVELHPATPSERIPQLWDELRRKVESVAMTLPNGAGPITVTDDFGDVYGLYFALCSDGGYSWDEMRNYAKNIVTQLYKVDGVEKVVLYGEQSPEVKILISPSTLAAFELSPTDISSAIGEQSRMVALGVRRAGDVDVELVEGTIYSSIADIESQLLRAADGKQYRLGDVARVERGYKEPATIRLKVDGRDAIGIAVASAPEKDVVRVGADVDAIIASASASLPAGVEIVSLYPENLIAAEANYDFIINLIESLLIVIVLIMIIMGLRSGVVVGSSLVLAIGGTLLLMLGIGEGLNRTSLAGFIIAMGMLVDNAIVVVDNTRRLRASGLNIVDAAVRGATEPRMALLAATLIAIVSFLPLQLAPSSVAEIIRPLFVVVSISLLLSWVLALTQVPLMSVQLLNSYVASDVKQRLDWFSRLITRLLSHRWLTISGAIALFALSLWAMGRMPQNFFPQLDKAYFRADVLLPEGYDIEATQHRLDRMSEWLLSQPEVCRVSTTAGATPPRYYLASSSYADRANYGNLLVELHDSRHTAALEERFDRWVEQNIADVWLRSSLFKLSPVPDATIEFGFVGDSVDTLQQLASRTMAVMSRNKDTRNVRNSWGNRVAVWCPEYSQLKAQRLGVTRASMLTSLEIVSNGLHIAQLRDGDQTLPVLLCADMLDDRSLVALEAMPVFSRSGASYAIEQAAAGFDFGFQGSVIKRVDGERVVKAQCDPRRGVNTLQLLAQLRDEVAREVVIPEGYRLELFGEEESREESNRAIGDKLPLTLVLIFVILLFNFGNCRDPLVVLLTLPLIFTGVVLGLLVAGKLFDFFSLLGLLGLVGMNVKNGVILVERINELRAMNITPFEAIVRAASDRFLPVVAAAGTTILGMIPLLFDSLFGSMAATIMGGLFVATLLVLMLLPVVYSLIYRIKP
ncbi:MAG: efflux RND transporter permease subunit [Alistipes sp.]|nr:efflux RND transporter permease subunit [Alistipes sp.]